MRASWLDVANKFTCIPQQIPLHGMQVRVKPQQAKVEVDLAVDSASDTYNSDASPRLRVPSQVGDCGQLVKNECEISAELNERAVEPLVFILSS